MNKNFVWFMAAIAATGGLLFGFDTGVISGHIGDLVVELAPGWQMQNDDTHEQIQIKQQLAYFPIIFYGANIPAERVKTPVSIERIAPTISKAIRIRAPNACMATPLF